MLLQYITSLVVSQTSDDGWWSVVQRHTLYQLLSTDRNILIVLGCWILTWIIGKMIINNSTLKNYREHWIYGLKLAICSSAVWIPGLRPGLPKGQIELAAGTGISGEEIGYRLVLGSILAGIAIILPIVANWAIGKYLPEKLAKSIKRVMFV